MRIVGVVGLTIALATSAHAGDLELGGTALRSAELVVADGHHLRRTPLVPVTGLPCADGQRCVRLGADDQELSVALDLGPGLRALPLTIEAHVKKATKLRQVSVRLHFTAASFELLGRDYRIARARHAILDRFDPKWIGLRKGAELVAAIIVDHDVDALLVTAVPGGVELDFELLAAAARPFGHLPRCGHNWRDVKGRVAVPDRHLVAGEILVAHGEVVLGESPPVALSPWPQGRAAAFSITDHADQTSAYTLRALLTGASDGDLAHPAGGLLGHAVPITKALFQRGAMPHGGLRPQLEDPTVVELADLARKHGNEIVPHSATPLTDDRRQTEETLAWFAARGAHVWIDHQPQTNKEGFCQSGWHTTSGIADLLEKHGYRDVWDLTEWSGGGLDQRDPRHLERRAPTLWPLGRLEATGPETLWMFRSTWAFIPTRHFFLRYTDKALDQLETDRGVHVAHTYLETLHARGTFFGRRNLVLRERDGRVRLDPKLEALFASLQQRTERGSLWVAPLGVIGERLRALRHARVRITEAGAIGVERPPGLDDLTVHVGDGKKLSGELVDQRTAGGETRAWLKPCPAPPAACTTELTR